MKKGEIQEKIDSGELETKPDFVPPVDIDPPIDDADPGLEPPKDEVDPEKPGDDAGTEKPDGEVEEEKPIDEEEPVDDGGIAVGGGGGIAGGGFGAAPDVEPPTIVSASATANENSEVSIKRGLCGKRR